MTTRLERAHDLVEPYRCRPGVVGAYLGGSSTRPYVDALADLDLFVVFDDEAFAALTERERYVLTITADLPRRKDVETICLPWAALEDYTRTHRDSIRAGFHFSPVLFARDARLAEITARIAALPEADRQDRLRVHYYELLWAADKAKKARKRGNVANARLLEGSALDAARRLLFVVRRRWPARRDWATHELVDAGIPTPLLEQWADALGSDAPALDDLRGALDPWLTAEGHSFHQNSFVLTNWCQFTAEGRAACERWSFVI